jgi:UDP-N-acetylglucosamine 3-dehydrogenase
MRWLPTMCCARMDRSLEGSTFRQNGYAKRMNRVKVGIIGVGLWGVNHIEAYRGLPHAEVFAVADPAPGRAKEVARKFGIPHWFENYEDLCAVNEIDAVSIVSPESAHLKPVEAAARAGKHILLEKPIAYSVAEGERMLASARQAGVILMPGHLLRFETRYALIKEALNQHDLGSVVSIQARRNRTKGNFKKYARAHPIFAVAVHDIDLLLWYAQSKVRRVRGYQRSIQGGPVPDVVWGIIEFNNGVLGIIETTWLTPDAVGVFSNDSLQLITDNGIARVDLVDGGLSFWLESGLSVPDTIGAPKIRGHIEGSLAAELSYFLGCVTNGTMPEVVTAEEALEGIRVAVALVESASKQQDVLLV